MINTPFLKPWAKTETCWFSMIFRDLIRGRSPILIR
jgi:hypothetical protein